MLMLARTVIYGDDEEDVLTGENALAGGGDCPALVVRSDPDGGEALWEGEGEPCLMVAELDVGIT